MSLAVIVFFRKSDLLATLGRGVFQVAVRFFVEKVLMSFQSIFGQFLEALEIAT